MLPAIRTLSRRADAVMTYLYLGYHDPEREKIEIARIARVARDCERWGVVLMTEPRSAREATHPKHKSDYGRNIYWAGDPGAELERHSRFVHGDT